jgi:hypothetical protein
MNSLWDIRIFLGLVPKESPCIRDSNILIMYISSAKYNLLVLVYPWGRGQVVYVASGS